MRMVFPIAAAVLLSAVSSPAAPAKGARAARQSGGDAGVAAEFRRGDRTKATAATFGPERTAPVQRGQFVVELVVIAFPDCAPPESAAEVKKALSTLDGSFSIADYYKDYSQGVTWPVLEEYPAIYTAPQPLGYYCRYDLMKNLPGYKNDGPERARKLREDALKYVQSKGRPKAKGAYVCYVYCNGSRKDVSEVESILAPFYPNRPSPEAVANGAVDKLAIYEPKICWADPLWPNSIPQVGYPSNGRVLVHELGHVLGAPDYYHASEEHDGVEGVPCLPWDYGPTGPAYCRYIYHAFVPQGAYPKATAPGEYTLAPRSARFQRGSAGSEIPLGLLVPSSHPNYIFCIEYCHGEKPPVGHPDAEGLLVHAINVTMTSPMMGPPDLCYTYRTGDRDHKALGEGAAYFRPGDEFGPDSDPAAILPNFMPAGIAIKDIKTDSASGTCTFMLEMPEVKATRQELDFSLLPQTEMVSLDGFMPTSFHATMNVKYRGEPLLTEYGFCYGTKKDPTEKTGRLFPLYHRDRYDARIIDLEPGTMYYVRAYARNANGIRYSANQKGVKLPPADGIKGRPTLFSDSDRLLSTWYVRQWYFGMDDGVVKSSNPLLAFMALAQYYRALPGQAPGAPLPFDMKKVHGNPADSRPKFRLAETDRLRTSLEGTLRAAGLLQSDFAVDDAPAAGGKKKKTAKPASSRAPARGGRQSSSDFGGKAAWVAKCAAALKIKKPGDVFRSAKTEEELLSHKEEIAKWVLQSRPVLLVRQNRPLTDEISERWPLDVAIIDGLGGDPGSFHVVFPCGCDRGDASRTDGVTNLGDLLHRTSDAILMFYRPGVQQ